MALTKEKLKELFAAGEFDQYLPDPVVTWASITGKPSTFPPSTHNHTKAQITDFPTSMPASDVSAWAKAATKPSYTHTEVGAAAASHTHTKANITDFPTSMPASDVSAWAKAATKPTYTAAEVGAAATTGTGASGTWPISITGNVSKASGAFRVTTASGYVDIGPVNTGWMHFSTDRANFHFNKGIGVTGDILAGPSYNQRVYHAGNLRHGTAAPTGGVDGDIYIQY